MLGLWFVLVPIVSAILISAILIVAGLVRRRWGVATAGFVLLALTVVIVFYLGVVVFAV